MDACFLSFHSHIIFFLCVSKYAQVGTDQHPDLRLSAPPVAEPHNRGYDWPAYSWCGSFSRPLARSVQVRLRYGGIQAPNSSRIRLCTLTLPHLTSRSLPTPYGARLVPIGRPGRIRFRNQSEHPQSPRSEPCGVALTASLTKLLATPTMCREYSSRGRLQPKNLCGTSVNTSSAR